MSPTSGTSCPNTSETRSGSSVDTNQRKNDTRSDTIQFFFRFHRRANNNKRNQEQPRRTIFFFSYLNGGEGGNNGRAAESMSDEREMRQMTLNVRLQDNLRPRVA